MRDLFVDVGGPAPEMLQGADVVTEGDARSWACFSMDHTFRYLFGRQWDACAPWFVCGMKNPSIAGGQEDDPTVRRVLGFARREHCGGILVWNAGARVATDPAEWLKSDDPVGPRNHEAIRAAVKRPLLAVCVLAWGKPANKREAKILTSAKLTAVTFRRHRQIGAATKDGWPRHPLYLRADAPLVPLGDSCEHLTRNTEDR